MFQDEQEKIFVACFKLYQWNQIRKKLGLDDLKFHDLHRALGFVFAHNGISTAVIQKQLEHSLADLKKKVYTNVDFISRYIVNKIPANDWL